MGQPDRQPNDVTLAAGAYPTQQLFQGATGGPLVGIGYRHFFGRRWYVGVAAHFRLRVRVEGAVTALRPEGDFALNLGLEL